MARPRIRFTLADLLLYVAWAGLWVAWTAFIVKTNFGWSALRPGDRTTLVILVVASVVVTVVQSYVRAGRTSPTCSVCGRRFLARPQPTETVVCPKCRQRSLSPVQSRKQQALGWGCIVVGLAALSVPSGLYFANSVSASTGFRYWIAVPLATLTAVEFFLVLFFLLAFMLVKRAALTCTACGCRFRSTPQPVESATCTICRQAIFTADQLRKEQVRGWTLIVGALVSLSVLSGLFYANSVAALTGFGFGIAVPLAIVISAVGWTACLFLPLLAVGAVRRRLLRNERFVRFLARRSAGIEGTESRAGPITIWSGASSDPAPMLRDQLEVAHARMLLLIGRDLGSPSRLRIYWFDQRDSYLRLMQRLGIGWWREPGIYLTAPARIGVLTGEQTAHHLGEPSESYLTTFGHYWLESTKGFPVPLWLGRLVTSVLVENGDPASITRNDRRMIQAINSRRAFDASALFPPNGKGLTKLMRNKAQFDCFIKLSQRDEQLRSVGEYLIGATAAPDRRTRFVAFLMDLKAKDSHEDKFRRHFGYGFDQLLQDWRVWVLDRGEAPHVPPPPHILDALFHRVIPTIRNSQSPQPRRINAVRAMGQAGFVVGADALIELLRNGGEIPRAELLWGSSQSPV